MLWRGRYPVGPDECRLFRSPVVLPTTISSSATVDGATSSGSAATFPPTISCARPKRRQAGRLTRLVFREVHYADANALVIDFIDGQTLTPEDVRSDRNHARLIDLIKRAHREIPRHFQGPAPLFWVFQVARHYDRMLRDLHSPHVAILPGLAGMASG